MKKISKVLSVFLSLLMVISIIPMTSITASAATQTEAVAWANDQVGKSIDYDGVEGVQCVDLIKAYYAYLGVSPVKGHGRQYATNALPSGWSRIAYYNGFVPQPGDIVVWTYASSSYGHVAIVTSASTSYINVVEQNKSTGVQTNRYTYTYGTLYGVVRPCYSKSYAKPSVSIDASTKTLGENATFSFNAPGATSLHLYIYKGTEKYFEGEFSPSTTYSRVFYATGHYSCYIVAHYPSGNIESDWLGFDIVELSVSIDSNVKVINDDMTFSFVAPNAISVHLYIYKDSVKYFEGEFALNTTYTRPAYEVGKYQYYIVAHFKSGDVQSRILEFEIVLPKVYVSKSELNMGEEVTFSFDSPSAKSVHLYIHKNGNQYFECELSPTSTYQGNFDSGEYCCYIIVHYANGVAVSEMETFAVKNNTYTILYNANGGTDAPTSQSKVHGTTLTLSNTKPTRTGYTFLGWSTSSTAITATYQPGDSFTANANTTLYAVWKANTYNVRFDANGGTGSMSNQVFTYDTAKALSVNVFTREGYTFLGWSKSATATTATYTDKQLVKNLTATNGGYVTLYAVWQKNTVTPDVPDEDFTFSIQEPSRTEIRNKDGIILHTNVEGELPDGARVEWSWDNSKFDVEKNDDGTLTIIAENNGKTTFTATVYDVDGTEIAQDTIIMNSKSGFFDKIGGFFRSLFGATTIYKN